MRDVAIKDPAVEDLGPFMRALTPQQRRFVIGWIESGCHNAARVARAAGYKDSSGASRVKAHYLLRNPKITAAIEEEAGRELRSAVPVAIQTLKRLAGDDDKNLAFKAAVAVLDRTGYGTTTKQEIHVEHADTRSTEELIRLVQGFLPDRRAQVIEGELVEG